MDWVRLGELQRHCAAYSREVEGAALFQGGDGTGILLVCYPTALAEYAHCVHSVKLIDGKVHAWKHCMGSSSMHFTNHLTPGMQLEGRNDRLAAQI